MKDVSDLDAEDARTEKMRMKNFISFKVYFLDITLKLQTMKLRILITPNVALHNKLAGKYKKFIYSDTFTDNHVFKSTHNFRRIES